jgi:hypothetical protein
MGVAMLTRVRPSIGAEKMRIWICFSRSRIWNVVLLLSEKIFDRVFFVEKSCPISTKDLGRLVRRNIPETHSSILIILRHMGHRGISTPSASQEFLIRRTTEISHRETFDYSRRWKKVGRIRVWKFNWSVSCNEHHSQYDSSWWVYISVWWIEMQNIWMHG